MNEKDTTKDHSRVLRLNDDISARYGGLSIDFKANPTIENYVKLRRENPDALIEIAISSGIEWLFSNEETLRNFDIDPQIVASALDADNEAISELSLILLEKIIERNKREKAGETHLPSRGIAIADSLVNFLINMMLDAIEWNNESLLNRDLIVLIRNQTGGDRNSWAKKPKSNASKKDAIWIAAQIIMDGREPSYRNISKLINVNVTTVSRWFSDGNFIDEARRFAALLSRMRAHTAEQKSTDGHER